MTKPKIISRILAGFIDYVLINIFAIVMIVSLGTQTTDGGYELNGFPALIPMIFWFFMTIGTEQIFRVTLGNYTMDLKAIPINGDSNKLSFGQSLKRHL